MSALFPKDKMQGNKKTIENLVLILVLFIIVIVVMNGFEKKSTKGGDTDERIAQSAINNIRDKSLDEKLEEILSLIDGAGKVDVLVTYSEGGKQIPIYNIKESKTVTQETDKVGGTRKTEENSNEQSVVFSETGSTKTPIIAQTINPEVIGVLVVADGGNNVKGKESFITSPSACSNI